MAERIIGIDFGTSTSVIRVKRYENGKPIGEALETKDVIFGGSGATVPTLIMKKDDDASVAYYGHEAQQKKRKFTNYSSFKVDLESANAEKRAEARKLTEEFFAFMGKQYRDQSDGSHLGSSDDRERTIISYPVKWSEETKQFMIAAAKKAGFPNVSGMDEAQAAIHAVTVMSEDHLRKNHLLVNGTPTNILLIDMGAGTTDLVLCRHTPGAVAKTEILTTWPKSGKILFGGKEIDALLKNFFWDKLDEADAQMVFKRIGTDKFKSWKEESVSPALRNNDSVSDFEVLDQCVEMMEIDMDEYCLDRAAFEKCLANYLKQLPVLINGCIESAGIKGSDVDLVIVTGGHSQWYFVQEMLAGKMPQFGAVDLPKIKANPTRIIPITRPQETVALGLVYSPMQIAIPESDDNNQKKEEYERKHIEEAARKLKEVQLRLMAEAQKREEARQQEVVRQAATRNMAAEPGYTSENEFELGNIGEDYFIRKYVGRRKEVSIPPVIRGRKVVAIGEYAFSGPTILQYNRTIEKVIIPQTVTKIGKCAFGGASKLKIVIAHDQIESIGLSAFMGCHAIQTMDFGMGCGGDKIVRLPKGLKKLGAQSFGGGEISCKVVREATISKTTKLKKLMGVGPFHRNCAIFYYDD